MPARILFVLPGLTGSGAAQVAVTLMQNLDASRFEPAVVPFYAGNDYQKELPAGLRVLPLHERSPQRFGRLGWRLLRLIRRERPDLLLAFGNRANCISVIAAKLARTGTRLVLSEHSAMECSTRRTRRRRLLGRLTRWTHPRADAVVAVSEGIRRDLIGGFGLSPGLVRTIYNPIGVLRVRALAAEPAPEMADGSGLPAVITCGRLVAEKNQALLLRAFRDVQGKCPSRLVIAGDGELRAELERLAAELGVRERVRFLGFQANPFRLMAKAACFALSSRWEGFPMVLLEAMACGAPVVSADCDYGPREIITPERNGLLVPPGDQAALAVALARVLTDAELRARLAAEASRTVLRYDAPAVTRQYEGLFEEVLGKSGRGGGA